MKPKEIFNIFSKNKLKAEPKERKKITIDYREKNCLVPSELRRQGMDIEFRELKVGDYIVGDVVIERKTVSDFLSSMINRRLIKQLEELQQYNNKLLIIEGIDERELYKDENPAGTRVNANAIRGFLLSIALRHKVPFIFTKNTEDTAKYISVLSRKSEGEVSLNAKKKSLNAKEQLQFIIESFPGIGPKTAKKLLEEFKTIKNIMNASAEALKKIIGKKAEVIIGLVEKDY
jgi:Fanconi anemia group M protein